MVVVRRKWSWDWVAVGKFSLWQQNVWHTQTDQWRKNEKFLLCFHQMNDFKGPYSFTSKTLVKFSFNSVINVVLLEADEVSFTITHRIKKWSWLRRKCKRGLMFDFESLTIIAESQGYLLKCGQSVAHRIAIFGEDGNDQILKILICVGWLTNQSRNIQIAVEIRVGDIASFNIEILTCYVS